MRALDLTLLTDLYELTMMQGYFKNPTDQVVVFDAFYRQNRVTAVMPSQPAWNRSSNISVTCTFSGRCGISAGLNLFDDDFLEYLRGFHFTGDIYASRKEPLYSRENRS